MLTLSKFIKEIGLRNISKKVGVLPQNVSQWHLKQTAPRPRHAHALIKISKGRLTLEGIYSPFIKAKIKNKEWK